MSVENHVSAVHQPLQTWTDPLPIEDCGRQFGSRGLALNSHREVLAAGCLNNYLVAWVGLEGHLFFFGGCREGIHGRGFSEDVEFGAIADAILD